MDKIKKLLALFTVICLLLSGLAGCSQPDEKDLPTCSDGANVNDNSAEPEQGSEQADDTPAISEVDHAAAVKLDMDSATAKQEVTVKMFIDGDTTHFYVPDSVMPGGVLKARYLGINTPESTGKIEEYGKKASAFTKEKLSAATSIIIESEDGKWNADSTGDRYLVWVWYKTAEADTYRNLNIEILQNGLAIANSSANNRYGETCMAAINQAKALKLNVYSGEKDPDYYYGEAVELTLKELRTNIEAYSGVRVAFSGVVTMNDNNSVYVESFDPETNMYYGMAVYYGFNLNGQALDILNVGNEVRIVGSVQYYEGGGTWQVSDLEYRLMKPDDPNNIQKLSDGHTPAYPLIDAATLLESQVAVEVDEQMVSFPYGALAMNSSIQMKGLYVRDGYTTQNEESSSKGAFSLFCTVDGQDITVRTIVLHDENGELVKMDRFIGKTIDVRGLIDYYDGSYQIKVFSHEDITITN